MDKEEGVSDFESGYEGDNTPAEKPVDEPVVEEVKAVEEPVATPEPEPEKPDPYKELLNRFDKLEQRTRNAEGHIGGLNHNQKLIQETMAASKAVADKVSEAPSQQQVKEAMANPKEWDDLKTDFPEWASATEKLLDARIGKPEKVDIEALQKEVTERVRNETTESMRKEIINSSLDAVFPGWAEEVATPAFAEWANAQTEEVKQLFTSPKVSDAAKMLRLYENRAKPKEAPKPSQRQKLMEAAVAPKGNGGSPVNRTDIDEFEAGYSSR